jgi:hypothetical protein
MRRPHPDEDTVGVRPCGAVGRRWEPFAILGSAIIFLIGGLYRYGTHRALARNRAIGIGRQTRVRVVAG